MTITATARNSGNIKSVIDRLQSLLESDLEGVETLLRQRAKSPVDIIPDLSGYIVSAGGKRLRPMLTLAAAQAVGGANPSTHALAAAVEFIHTATLLHDDVVDESDLRRGKPAAKSVWGNSASILVGDFLFARAFTLMVETGSLEILDILSNASSVIAEGEVRQLAAQGKLDLPTEDYLAIIEAKTAALFPLPSGDFGEVIREHQLLGMELSNDGLAAFHGGLPLFDGEQLIGAIGVSGGSADEDLEIATYALL